MGINIPNLLQKLYAVVLRYRLPHIPGEFLCLIRSKLWNLSHCNIVHGFGDDSEIIVLRCVSPETRKHRLQMSMIDKLLNRYTSPSEGMEKFLGNCVYVLRQVGCFLGNVQAF